MSIELDRDGHVAVITINRPERLNALDAQHYSDLAEAWVEVRDDRSIRAAVVTGAGERSFSVGADLKSFIPDAPELGEFWLTQREQLLNRGLEVWTPVIAAVNGLLPRRRDDAAARNRPPGRRGPRHVRSARRSSEACCRQTAGPSGSSISCRSRSGWRCCSPGSRSTPSRRSAGAGQSRRAGRTSCSRPRSDYARADRRERAARRARRAKELAYRSRDLDLAAGLRLEQAMARIVREQQRRARGRAAFAEKRAAGTSTAPSRTSHCSNYQNRCPIT